MKILPQGKFGWILVVFIFYAYYKEYSPKYSSSQASISQSVSSTSGGAIPAPTNGSQNSAKTENTMKDKIVSRIRENETGKVLIEALAKKAVEDKYGKSDLQTITSRETGRLTIINTLRGEGDSLNCGAKAVINYEAFTSAGIKFDTTINKDGSASPIIIRTGGEQVIKGLEAGIIGMKVGGKRKISIPAELAFDNQKFTNSLISKGDTVLYNVELMEIKPGPYKTNVSVNSLNETPGSGEPALCGDKVRISYSFSTSEGATIPDANGEVTFRTGNGEVPIGLEFAVMNMKKGGLKLASLHPALLQTAGRNILPNIKFPDGETINVQINMLEISD